MRRAHAREEVVLHLEVETARETSGDRAAVRARGFDLGPEPAHRLSRRAISGCGIALGMLEIVRQREQHRQYETLTRAHQQYDADGMQGATIVHERAEYVQVQIPRPKSNGILPPPYDVFVLHSYANVLRPGMSKIQDLGIEHHRHPIQAQHHEEVRSLEFVPKPTLGMTRGIWVECKQGLRAEAVGVLLGVVGVGVVSPEGSITSQVHNGALV